jgi:amino acid transporter
MGLTHATAMVKVTAIVVILILSAINLRGVKQGSTLQTLITLVGSTPVTRPLFWVGVPSAGP